MKEEQLSDRAQEFPRVDERVVSLPHRYGYTASLSVGGDLGFDGNSIIKHDLDTGAEEVHDFGAGRTPPARPCSCPARPTPPRTTAG